MSSKKSPHLRPILYALLAALLFGLNAPAAKLLVARVDPLFMAALLYLGAGAGMLGLGALRRDKPGELRESRLSREELPFVLLMVLLDIAAPILLMLGLSRASAATASLLGNFEIAATAFFALVLFREAIGRRMWLAILLITAASVLLSLNDLTAFSFSTGALLVLGASLCWGLENNTTRKLSIKDPLQVVVIKGFGSGFGALIVTGIWGDFSAPLLAILAALALGFVAYGLSIFFYVKAQRDLGAARTSAYYAAAPFIGMALSWLLLREALSPLFFAALFIMLIGAALAISENHAHPHFHQQTTHEHRHSHADGHHNHPHDTSLTAEHSHQHTHEPLTHDHAHLPDTHHRHEHK
ncbi:MAG: EamA family transporter [Anaerolineaceae bacterium]|jgi:drug/metabolite transporter (DMT)-like permease